MINMKSRLFYFILLILPLIGCATFTTGKYDIEDIQQGKYLSAAEEVTVEFFFKNRMENCGWCDVSPFSDQHRWNILYEDDDFVYFAYVLPLYPTKHDFSIGKYDNFYKVDIVELKKHFSQYKDIQGHHIWDKTKNIRLAETKTVQCTSYEETFAFDLLEEHIEAVYTLYCLEGSWKLKRHGELARLKILLDKDTLELIESQKEL